MATKTLCFIVQKPPYKSEASKLALTHAIASQSVEIYLDDDDMVEAKVAFIGDGVLNCTQGQKSMEHYGIVSLSDHIRNTLLVDVKTLVCKEDLENFGLSEDVVPNAEDLGADISIELVSFDEINEEMAASDHLLFI
jgi:sulfur relay (sulfurtransferase) DsrF/TusC family protein